MAGRSRPPAKVAIAAARLWCGCRSSCNRRSRPLSSLLLGLIVEPATRVLIVEDNDDARTSLRTLLEHRGQAVVEAADGPSGVALALDAKPDLTLTDIGLPGFDGNEVGAPRLPIRR